MEEERSAITIGKIFKVAFGKWKLLVPVTVVLTVAFSLAIILGYNPYKGYYTSDFTYSSPDLSAEQYADGSKMNYGDLISYDNLTKVKESNEKYASIDVDKLLDTSAISIKKIDKDSNEYRLTLSYSKMKDYSLAKSFLCDIAKSAISQDQTVVETGNFDSSLILFDNADSFEKQILYLESQAKNLINIYKTMENDKNIVLPKNVLESVGTNRQKIENVFTDNFSKELNYIVLSNGYVKDYNSDDAKFLDNKVISLEQEKVLNNAKIDDLKQRIKELVDVGAPVNNLNEEVVKLSFRNSEIDYELDGIQKKLDNKGKDPSTIPGYNDFVTNLLSYRNILAGDVTLYRQLLNDAYIKNSSVNYSTASAVQLNGTISTVVAIGVSFVTALVIAGIVDLIVDRKKLAQ